MLLRTVRTALLLVVVTLHLPKVAAGQEVNGGMQGRVVDPDGHPVSGALITLRSSALLAPRPVFTNEYGYFKVAALPVGRYTLELEALAYRRVRIDSLHVSLGENATVGQIQLVRDPVNVAPITIVAERPLLDLTSSALSTNVTATQFELLPIARDFSSVASLSPQANQSFLKDGINIGGGSGVENMYFIDGINVTDPYRAMSGTRLPYNFVREVRVRQGGYAAEYGRAMGGIVDVITHSGSDNLKANLFAFGSTDALTSHAAGELLRTSGQREFDVGFSLSGPIRKESIWFFAAYNPSAETKDVELLNAGLHRDRRITHAFAGKVNWKINEASEAILTVTGDPAIHHRAGALVLSPSLPTALLNPDPMLSRYETGGINISLSGRSLRGQKLLLEGAAALHTRVENLTGETAVGRDESQLVDFAAGNVWSGGFGHDGHTRSMRSSFTASATAMGGAHTIKLGAAYEANVMHQDWHMTGVGSLYKSADPVNPYYIVNLYYNDATASNRMPTLYIQDSWQVTSYLSLNPGLRWDGQYFFAAGDSLAQSLTRQFQPRLGAVYQLGTAAAKKVFASFGRYYQELPLFLPLNAYSGWLDCEGLVATDPRLGGVAPPVPCVGGVEARVSGLKGDHFDEIAAGYEQVVGQTTKLAVRITQRKLRDAIGFASPDTTFGTARHFTIANYGEGKLSSLPKPRRDYRAAEISIQRNGERTKLLASYVYSRSYGNYTGLFSSDQNIELLNNFSLSIREQAVNSTGRLPNDIPHVLKVSGSYAFSNSTTAGAFFSAQSGTPLNEFGATGVNFRPAFLVPRGSLKRSPALWDLNLRVRQTSPFDMFPGQLIVDLQHIGNPRRAVLIDQFHYQSLDLATMQQASPNPQFGKPIRYQDPMRIRIGFERVF